jgi:hypothetical protein
MPTQYYFLCATYHCAWHGYMQLGVHSTSVYAMDVPGIGMHKKWLLFSGKIYDAHFFHIKCRWIILCSLKDGA